MVAKFLPSEAFFSKKWPTINEVRFFKKKPIFYNYTSAKVFMVCRIVPSFCKSGHTCMSILLIPGSQLVK